MRWLNLLPHNMYKVTIIFTMVVTFTSQHLSVFMTLDLNQLIFLLVLGFCLLLTFRNNVSLIWLLYKKMCLL